MQVASLTHLYDDWWAVDVHVQREDGPLAVFGDNVQARDEVTAQQLAVEMLHRSGRTNLGPWTAAGEGRWEAEVRS